MSSSKLLVSLILFFTFLFSSQSYALSTVIDTAKTDDFNLLINPDIKNSIANLENQGQLLLLGYGYIADHNPSLLTPENIIQTYSGVGGNSLSDKIYKEYKMTHDAFKKKELAQQLKNAVMSMISNYRGVRALTYTIKDDHDAKLTFGSLHYVSRYFLDHYDFKKQGFELRNSNIEKNLNPLIIPFNHQDFVTVLRPPYPIHSSIIGTYLLDSTLLSVPNESQARIIESNLTKDNLGWYATGTYALSYISDSVVLTPKSMTVLFYSIQPREKLIKQTFLFHKF